MPISISAHLVTCAFLRRHSGCHHSTPTINDNMPTIPFIFIKPLNLPNSTDLRALPCSLTSTPLIISSPLACKPDISTNRSACRPPTRQRYERSANEDLSHDIIVHSAFGGIIVLKRQVLNLNSERLIE